MVKWRTSPAAVWWTLVFLLVALNLVKSTQTEENSEGTTSYTDIFNEYADPSTEIALSDTEIPQVNTNDPQRSERMVTVYVKPDPKAETKNITDFFDSEEVVYTNGDKGTIIVSESKAADDEVMQEDGDLMVMEGRSLKDNVTDKSLSKAGEFQSEKRPNSIKPEFNLKDVFNKWSSEIDFNLSDLLKVNLASLLADDYEEMNRLMKENLVEDTDEFTHGTLPDALEPRDNNDGIDLDQAAAASSEMVQVLPVPAVTLPQLAPIFRPKLQRTGQMPIHQYTYPVHQSNQRSDSAPSYIFLPRTANGPGQAMAVLPTGNAVRLPMPAQTLPRTVAQRTQTSTATPPHLIRRPQTLSNQTTARPLGRFGERFAGRLPRPFQYIFNMTIGGRQTTEKSSLTFVPSSVSNLPSPSQSYPARVSALNRYYSLSSTRNHLPPPTRIRTGIVAAPTETRTTKPRVTSPASSSFEFGARIRPFRYERRKNSTNVTQNAKEDIKGTREMKINQLRSNLVGKLVVMQSMLDEKQEKSGNTVKQRVNLAATQPNRNGLPAGILKPIVPLRPKINSETTTTSSIHEEIEIANMKDTVPDTTTELTFGLKDKKKYRRPPSLRKGGNHKLSAEKQKTDDNPSNTVTNRESMVVLQIVEATSASTAENTTETSAISILPPSPSPETAISELRVITLPQNTTQIANSSESNSAATTTTPETETILPANTRDLTANLQESTSVKIVENVTETAIPRSTVETNGQQTSSSILTLVNAPVVTVDQQETTLAPVATVENATEIGTQQEGRPTSSFKVEMKNTSTFADRQDTTWATIGTIENATEIGTQQKGQPTSSYTVEMKNTPTITDRQETTWATIGTIENATETTSTKGDELVSTIMPELVTHLGTTISVETVTENLLVEKLSNSTSTYAPEDDPYLKAMIERALQIPYYGPEIKASPLNNEDIVPMWTDDFSEDEDDDVIDLDFPEGGSDTVLETNVERLSNGTLSRLDRSVGSTLSEGSSKKVDTSVSLRNENISPVLNLARGSIIRPINLPYNILPSAEVAITRNR